MGERNKAKGRTSRRQGRQAAPADSGTARLTGNRNRHPPPGAWFAPPLAPMPPGFSPGGCKGRSPLHKKTKILPLPAGKGGERNKAKGRVGRRQTRQAAPADSGTARLTGDRNRRPPPGAWFAPCPSAARVQPPGDARGAAPCIRKLKFSPFPTGEGGRGDGGKK